MNEGTKDSCSPDAPDRTIGPGVRRELDSE